MEDLRGLTKNGERVEEVLSFQSVISQELNTMLLSYYKEG